MKVRERDSRERCTKFAAPTRREITQVVRKRRVETHDEHVFCRRRLVEQLERQDPATSHIPQRLATRRIFAFDGLLAMFAAAGL